MCSSRFPVERTRCWGPRFASDERGIAAVEFAAILPMAALLFMGLAEFGNSLLVDRHMVQSAASLATTAAQLSIADLKDGQVQQLQQFDDEPTAGDDGQTGQVLLNGLQLALGSQGMTNIKASAVRIVRVQNNTLKRAWVWTSPGMKEPAIDSSTLLANMQEGESLLVASVSAERARLFRIFGGSTTLSGQYAAPVPRY